jgi:deferrochelatase/peroxidase EfeB
VTATGATLVELGDVQATVVELYRCPIAVHLPMGFGAAAGAREFLRELQPLLTMADHDHDPALSPDPLLNVGITCTGLTALGVDPAIVDALDVMYRRGPDAVRLGDVLGSASDPRGWWEGQFATEDIHCIVQLHLRDTGAVGTAVEHVRSLAAAHGVTELRPRANGELLRADSLGDQRVHFGYRDGISHPEIAWDDSPDTPSRVNFRHFLLGHASGSYPSRPRGGPAAGFARDSFYGVFRWLYQDVAAFNRYLRDNAPALPGGSEELLAAKLMGRWRDGTPLVLSPDEPGRFSDSDDFGYADDAGGRSCPFSAHIRIANPRDDAVDAVVGSVPRVIRRGMPYGPELTGTVDDRVDRGLMGVFLCADIAQQVYKLTGWMKHSAFRPRDGRDGYAQDAITGNRSEPDTRTDFVVPTADGDVTLPSLGEFIRTKGTAFLLYPSRVTMQTLIAG